MFCLQVAGDEDQSCLLRNFEASLMSLSSLFWDAQSEGASRPVPCGRIPLGNCCTVAPYVGPASEKYELAAR
jgi:hypothetical protein